MKEKDNNPGDIIDENSLAEDLYSGDNIDNSENDIRPVQITEEDIYEGNAGVCTLPCEEIIPPLAECIHQTKSFEFSIFMDKETNSRYVGIKVVSYHSGELKISLNMLEKLVTYIKERYR